MGRSHRDCILEWARLNPEKISLFLDRMAIDPTWQIAFRGVYDSLRLLYLRLFNEEARTVEMMELQLKHRIELILAEKRMCLERHEQELAVRRALVLYFLRGSRVSGTNRMEKEVTIAAKMAVQ